MIFISCRQNLTIPPAEKFDLKSFQFCDFDLDEMDTCLVAIRMFLDLELIKNFQIPYHVRAFCSFLITSLSQFSFIYVGCLSVGFEREKELQKG